MIQLPSPESFILKWRGDVLVVTLKLKTPRPGRAVFRTNIGGAKIRRREIIAENDLGITPLAKAWTDIPMEEIAKGCFSVEIPLYEVGIFSGKACFFAEGESIPEWPEGKNFHIKVESAETRKNNSIYTVFPRQFGSFREIVRRLPTIMDKMGFRIVQTLPPFPVPTTYAVMGEYGCPFAATDFFSVDPAMAEFDEYTTPLDQFKELIGAVHARKGLLFVDLPANHTGWASTLQTHHPDWFNRAADGRFISPGAWGVTWADLVELDYSNPLLRTYMADVFLFWCRNGVDGFRCDAGYMIPADTWEYIVARVRDEYPDTVFMLEGLGGELSVTDRLLAESNLDWAYSEIFQTYNRSQFEWYFPKAIERAEKYGTLVHFAETHDNDRLAKGGEIYARLRVQLSALLSWQGAWGIANGVEWYATEKIDVHGKNSLNWGAERNMIDLISHLNTILDTHPSFSGPTHLRMITRGDGNVLAVKRDGLLILANLDCANFQCVDWDRAVVNATEAIDILSGKKRDISTPVTLAPGEVLALQIRPVKDIVKILPEIVRHAVFHVEMPRDVNREICVPQGEWVEVKAPALFRVRLIDPKTNRTVRVFRTYGQRVFLDAPRYIGDGTRSRELRLEVTVYENGRSKPMWTRFLVPPPSRVARVKTSMDGSEVKSAGFYRTILSNGAGAAAQLRAGWGEIYSQYDAVLAANPDKNVPSDRLNLWARTRCWLQREGYTREFDKKCLKRFFVDPEGRFARWDFAVPCGMGKDTFFTLEYQLSDGENAARLKVTRISAGENEIGEQVRIVFRPDIEWRSFHSTTKAYMGLETLYPKHVVNVTPSGYEFSPYGDKFVMRVKNGVYHNEPQWTYNVGHPEEAQRGQDGSGDLFSPGWISADPKVGETVEIIGEYCAKEDKDVKKFVFFDSALAKNNSLLPIAEAMKRAVSLYVVKRDNLKTVIAGYPWFLDWGRDTFIAMRGLLAAGMKDDALKILKAFAAFEDKGTLPNIIYGNTAGNRDTTDAPLWFIRCVEEIGSKDPSLLKVCSSIVENYITGTPNGIKMDAESGLIYSPSHFSWMDTNYPACTPREGYPVEIQALWISALKFLGKTDLAKMAIESLEKYFKWEYGYRDSLSAPNGEPAKDAIKEDTIRPNQLFLITLGVLKDESIIKATEELLIPGGIRSLNSGHSLYRGVYAGDEDTSRKPAYHNGTVWAWPFPLYAEALVMMNMAKRETALSLLASAVENINTGCLSHISENADGDRPHSQKGCTAQAWSDSELLRVWTKLSAKD